MKQAICKVVATLFCDRRFGPSSIWPIWSPCVEGVSRFVNSSFAAVERDFSTPAGATSLWSVHAPNRLVAAGPATHSRILRISGRGRKRKGVKAARRGLPASLRASWLPWPACGRTSSGLDCDHAGFHIV